MIWKPLKTQNPRTVQLIDCGSLRGLGPNIFLRDGGGCPSADGFTDLHEGIARVISEPFRIGSHFELGAIPNWGHSDLGIIPNGTYFEWAAVAAQVCKAVISLRAIALRRDDLMFLAPCPWLPSHAAP